MEKRLANNYAVYSFELSHHKIYYKIQYNNTAITNISKLNYVPTEMGVPTPLTNSVFSQLSEYFSAERKHFDFKYELKGTEFQLRVWNALKTIPYGETRTYKDIATQIGNAKASRAVGMANNKNPLAIIIPCHRVIGAKGNLVGYASGLDIKKSLLTLEQENSK